MKKEIKHTFGRSFFPRDAAFESEDDSWQISYLDIITIVLAFLIIMLTVTEVGSSMMSSLSTLFGKNSDSTEYLTTPIEEIQSDLEVLLEDQILLGNLEINRDLNDLVIRFKGDDFYSSGSPVIEPKGRVILNEVITAIQSLQWDDFNIDVEGHTDNDPIRNAAFPSNWELSAARATNVVRYFENNEIRSNRLNASGFADSRPVIEYDSLGYPFAAPKSVNRRIVLRLYYTSDQLMASQLDTTRSLIAETGETAIPEIQGETVTPSAENQGNPIASIPKVVPVQSSITGPGLQCLYSLEAGSTMNLSEAFRIANSAENATGSEFRLVEIDNRFHIRSESQNTLTSLEDQAIIMNSTSGPGTLVHYCSENSLSEPQYLEFKIQFGAFRSELNAQRYADNLKDSYSIPAYTEYTGNTFKVVTGPYVSREEVSRNYDVYRDLELENNFFIKSVGPTQNTTTTYFRIQMARSAEMAVLENIRAEVLQNTGLSSDIHDSGNSEYLLLSSRISDPGRIQNILTELEALLPQSQFILHRLEFR